MPGAWRDSAISQLDAIAAANDAAIVSARRRKLAWSVAMAAALLWLVSGTLPNPARDSAQRQSRSPAAATTSALPVVNRLAVRGTVTEAPPGAPVVVPEALPAAAAVVDDAPRKQQPAQVTQSRRKAAQLAQERARVDEAAQRQQRESEQDAAEHAKAMQQAEAARERAYAAEQAERQALGAARSAQDTRRGVREACASSGGLLSQQFCHARECRRAEHQDDAMCARLREIEVARLQYGVEH